MRLPPADLVDEGEDPIMSITTEFSPTTKEPEDQAYTCGDGADTVDAVEAEGSIREQSLIVVTCTIFKLFIFD